MNESISKLLSKAGTFSEEESLLLQKELQLRKVDKGDFLLKEGTVCSSLWFIISGSFYQYTLNTDLDKIIIDLNTTNDWLINHKSFTSRKPSKCAIEAFEDSSVYELSIESIHKLIALSQSFLQMGKILDVATARIEFFDNNNTPNEKYQHIINNRPQLLQKFPQTILASYLKITPETLSRVRKRIS